MMNNSAYTYTAKTKYIGRQSEKNDLKNARKFLYFIQTPRLVANPQTGVRPKFLHTAFLEGNRAWQIRDVFFCVGAPVYIDYLRFN